MNEETAIAEELGGPLQEPAQLTPLIALNVVGISAEPVDGEAPMDLDFDCFWDHDHGFMAEVTGNQRTAPFAGASLSQRLPFRGALAAPSIS